MNCSRAWRKWSLNINQLPWAPFVSRAISHGALPGRSLKMPKFALQGGEPAFLLHPPLRIWSSTISCSLWPRLPWALHSPQSLHGCGSNKVLLIFGPCWLLYDLKEVTTALQKPPGFLMFCCIVPPANVWMVELPHLGPGLANTRLLLSRKGLGGFSSMVSCRHFFAYMQELKVTSPKPHLLDFVFCSCHITLCPLPFSMFINPPQSCWLLSHLFLV